MHSPCFLQHGIRAARGEAGVMHARARRLYLPRGQKTRVPTEFFTGGINIVWSSGQARDCELGWWICLGVRCGPSIELGGYLGLLWILVWQVLIHSVGSTTRSMPLRCGRLGTEDPDTDRGGLPSGPTMRGPLGQTKVTPV